MSDLDNALKSVHSADSPEKWELAVRYLLESLASDALESAETCSRAWQEDSAGKPWRALARKCHGAANRFCASKES